MCVCVKKTRKTHTQSQGNVFSLKKWQIQKAFRQLRKKKKNKNKKMRVHRWNFLFYFIKFFIFKHSVHTELRTENTGH